jgi:hypothetical protein
LVVASSPIDSVPAPSLIRQLRRGFGWAFNDLPLAMCGDGPSRTDSGIRCRLFVRQRTTHRPPGVVYNSVALKNLFGLFRSICEK